MPSKTEGPAVTPSDWDRVAANDEFKDLLAAKARFIVPASLFFMTYYLIFAGKNAIYILTEQIYL